MSPLEIEIAMAFYTSPMGYENPRGCALAGETMERFKTLGLLMYREKGTEDHHVLEATEKLKAYCDALTSMPLPVERWLIPECDLNMDRS